MFLEILAALLHFDEHDGLPDVIGESCAAPVLLVLADAEFRRATDIQATGFAKGLKAAI